MNKTTNHQLITRQQVCELLTINNTTLWRIEKNGDFPKKILIGSRRIAYKSAEVEEWINKQQQLNRGKK